MRFQKCLVGAACCLAALVLVPRVNAQDHKGHDHAGHDHAAHGGEGHGGDGQSKMMASWMKNASPGEFHKHLQPLVGKWNTTTKFRLSKEAPWSESTGFSESKWAMGGRYIIENFKSFSVEMPFEGMGITGYDNTKKKYVSSWIDSMSTALMISTGTIDASHKVITFTGTYDDPMTGQKDKPQKATLTILNDNKIVMKMFERGQDGEWYMNLEVVYTRA